MVIQWENIKNFLKEQENFLFKKLKGEFNEDLEKWREENPQYISATCTLNNHEFNDGNSTRFYCGITDKWSVKSEDGSKENYIESPDFIKEYPEGFWEYLYGDE